MTMDIKENITARLFELQDNEYKQFTSKLMPTINPDSIIGVRTPALRNLAKEVFKNGEADSFLEILPHKYYEENNLHAFLIDLTKDYTRCIELLSYFLPYVNNWATCDSMSPMVFKKHRPELFEQCKIWLDTNDVYTVRFAIGMFMSHFLDEDFKEDTLLLVSEIRTDEYYINMMKAWFFATALAKQYDAVLPYIIEHRLDTWSHNKTIQKAIESYRITDKQKAYLRTLKIK